jgi:hypothetical protein
MLPVGRQVPVAGSYSSADEEEPPPVTSTCPLGNSVAVWPDRSVVILPVRLHVLVAGV